MAITYLDEEAKTKSKSNITYLDKEPTRKLSDIQTGPKTYLEALKQTFLDIPSAAIRSTILPKELGGKGFIRGATEFETIPTFEETYEKGKKLLPKPLQFLGDLANLHSKSMFGASVPEQADVATSPASWLPLAVGARMPVSATRGITKGGQIVEKGMKGVETGIEKIVTPVGRGVERTGALVSGIEPEVLSATRKLGFKNVIKRENFKPEVPASIADDITTGFTKAEELANTSYRSAMNETPKNFGGTIDVRNTVKTIKSVFKGSLGEATRGTQGNRLYKIMEELESRMPAPKGFYTGLGRETLPTSTILKRQLRGEKLQNIAGEVRLNKKQFMEVRDALNNLYRENPYDRNIKKVMDVLYTDGEKSGLTGLQKARSLQKQMFEARETLDKTGLVGERKLRNFKSMTKAEIEQLRNVEKYIGQPFVDKLEKWSLAQQYLSRASQASPVGIFGKAVRPLFRSYLRTLGTK